MAVFLRSFLPTRRLVCQSGLAQMAWQPFHRNFVAGISQTSPLALEQVMKTELLQGKTIEEVSDIWLQYHMKATARAGGVISSAEWQQIKKGAANSPLFVVPLAKPNDGYVTLLTQQQLPITLVTSLEEYRRYGSGAPACMTLTHYTELLDSVGLVLVRADIVNEQLINQAEARTVMELLRALYTNEDDFKMVRDFNHHPEAFSFDKLLSKLHINPKALPPVNEKHE